MPSSKRTTPMVRPAIRPVRALDGSPLGFGALEVVVAAGAGTGTTAVAELAGPPEVVA